MTRETSSTDPSSSIMPERPMLPWAEGAPEREDTGDAYTLGKEGAVMEVGLEPPVSVREVSGDSGRDNRDVSVIRWRDMVRSSDCARLVKERGFAKWSFILASRSESEPRFNASSLCRVLTGTPEPFTRDKWTGQTLV